MTNRNNPSLDVDFITSPNEQLTKHSTNFGTLYKIANLAFDPETTGASLLAESNIARQVADKRDIANSNLEFRVADGAEFEHNVTTNTAEYADLDGEVEVATDEDQLDVGDELVLERIIDLPDFLPSWFFQVGAARAKAVCKIEASGVDYKGNNGSWQGTGFLISPNLLLTNHHVLNSKEVAARAICVFNYETDETGRVQRTDSYILNPEKLFITSQANGGLDFTACWVESEAAAKYGFVPVYRHAFAIKNQDCANIVQHPDGRHKSVVVQKNEVYNQSDITVLYNSDTEPGSSGAFVCNNSWKLVALHHATRKIQDAVPEQNKKAVYRNEGIKMSAIATYLETLSDKDRDYTAARQVLDAFNGVDSAMGYFGSLGRQSTNGSASSDLEIVRNGYKGEEKDLDLCFWNIEWFNKNYKQKLKDVAWEISIQNLDVWVLSESSPEAAAALVEYLKKQYNLDYDHAASEPSAPSSKQTTTVIWNTRTTHVERKQWPEKVERWLNLNSQNFKDLDELQDELELEAVDGKIFDRYPGLFYVTAINAVGSTGHKFNFNLVPLHLKAMAEGAKRRKFACRILAESIQHCIEEGLDGEWILGGDLNATLASGDLQELSEGNLIALTASDAKAQSFSYLKKPYQSLIDHIYLSPNLSQLTDEDGFMILARDRDQSRDGNSTSDYLSISDHRPIMVRLSLLQQDSDENINNTDESESVAAAREIASIIMKRPLTKGIDYKRVPVRQELVSKTEALAVLESAHTRPYYDKEADELAKQNYYGTIPDDRSDLLQYFHDLVSRTHTTQLPYKPALYVYPWVDLHDDLQLVNLYSGEATAPETLIEADFEMEASELEGNGMYNCEHVVPQSWFNKRNPERGDLHHLFACTPNCNSFRGNIPYIEFPDWEEKTMGNCGKREADGFEPKRAKGIVARATLYFMLRYPDVNVRYKGQSFNDLLAWHLEEPPTEYEFHRNAAIQELQGNRNPFIDFPHLATEVDLVER